MAMSTRRLPAFLLAAALLTSVAADPALAQGGTLNSAPGGRTPNSAEGAPTGGTGNLVTVPTGQPQARTPAASTRTRQRAAARARAARRARAQATAPAATGAQRPPGASANPNFNVDDRVGPAGTSTGSSTGPGTGPTGTSLAR